MRLLLDAHTHIWAVDEPSKLTAAATAALQDPANELLVSGGTVWEIAIKVGLKKLSLTLPFRQWMNQAIADLGLSLVPITVEYADVQTALPNHHRDPFDRLVIAQARTDNITVVGADSVLDQYGVTRLW